MKPEDYSQQLQTLKAEWESIKQQLVEDYEDLKYLRKRVKELDKNMWLLITGKRFSSEEKKAVILKVNSYIALIREIRKIIQKQISGEDG